MAEEETKQTEEGEKKANKVPNKPND